MNRTPGFFLARTTTAVRGASTRNSPKNHGSHVAFSLGLGPKSTEMECYSAESAINW